MRVSRRPFCFALRARSLATALTSDAIAVALPPVAARLLRDAPGCRLTIAPIDPDRAAQQLDAGELDLALAPLPAVPQHLGSLDLFRLDGLVAMRPAHPLAGRLLRLADLADYPFIQVAFTATTRPAIGAPMTWGIADATLMMPRSRPAFAGLGSTRVDSAWLTDWKAP